METADSFLWLISCTVENPCSLRSASICWTTSTRVLLDTFAVLPSGEISLKSLQVSFMYGAGGLKPGPRKQLTTFNTSSYQAEREKAIHYRTDSGTLQRNNALPPP